MLWKRARQWRRRPLCLGPLCWRLGVGSGDALRCRPSEAFWVAEGVVVWPNVRGAAVVKTASAAGRMQSRSPRERKRSISSSCTGCHGLSAATLDVDRAFHGRVLSRASSEEIRIVSITSLAAARGARRRPVERKRERSSDCWGFATCALASTCDRAPEQTGINDPAHTPDARSVDGSATLDRLARGHLH